MNQNAEIEYLTRRVEQELDLADAARDPTVARVHRQMAALYAEKVAKLRIAPPVLIAELGVAPKAVLQTTMPQPSTSAR